MGKRRNLAGRMRPAVGAWGAVAVVICAIVPVAAHGRALPDGRGYELVSPSDKNGGDASRAFAAAPDGGRLAYNSPAAFGDAHSSSTVNSYVAQRNADGWTSRQMQPPTGSSNLGLAGAYTAADFSADLSKSISLSRSSAGEPAAQNAFVSSLDGTSRWVTAPTVAGAVIGDKLYTGRSADGSHIVFDSAEEFTSDPTGGSRQVWEWVDGVIRLVSVGVDGLPAGGVTGTGRNADNTTVTNFNGTLPEPTAVSADGRRIVFTDGYAGVYVREDGVRTRPVSRSQRAGTVGQPSPLPVTFAGAAEDGSRVYMVSTDQLTDDATPGGGLYWYDLTVPDSPASLHFASSGATDPAGAQLESVALISPDGRRSSFVALSQLVADKGVAGGHNLYMADDGGVTFVATLDTIPAAWQAASTADGKGFVFESGDRLTSFDNAGHVEVYLSSAPDGSLRCVSCPSGGAPAAGDAALAGEGLLTVTARSHPIADDGSRVFFETTEGLVPEDVNGRRDVYEYHDGDVALISAGTGGYDSTFWAATPSGSDVFFSTRDSLVGQDVDGGAADIYDARIGGGFPAPVEPAPCDGDACQPQPTVAPAAPAPAPGRSGAGSGAQQLRAPRLFVAPITVTGRRSALKTGTLTLVVSVEAGGRVRAGGTASYGDHRVRSLKPVTWTTKTAGSKRLKLRIPALALRQAQSHHSVRLAITVIYDKATRPARVVVTLR
jgi:hypothetical protein